MTHTGSGKPISHEFGGGFVQFHITTAHHTHDDIACCACGDRWPCIPAMMLREHLDAFAREHMNRPFNLEGPEMDKMIALIESIVGQRYELYALHYGFI